MKLDDGRLLRLKPQNLALAESAVSPAPAKVVPRTLSSSSVAPEEAEAEEPSRRGSLSSRLALFERKEAPPPTRMRRTHSFSGSSALPFFGDKSVERDRSMEREKSVDPSPLIKAKTAMFERKEEAKEEPRGRRVHGTGDNIYKRWMTDKVRSNTSLTMLQIFTFS